MSKDYSSLSEDSSKWAKNLVASAEDMDPENVGDPDLLAKAISKKAIGRELNQDEFEDFVEDRYGKEKRDELHEVLYTYSLNSRLPNKFDLSPNRSQKRKWENNWSAGFGFEDKEE